MAKVLVAKVRPQGIEYGKRQDAGHCALVDAIAHAIPGAQRIRADRDIIRWSDIDTGLFYKCRTPKSAIQFIDSFDAGKRVNPNYVLSIDDKDIIEIRPMGRRSPDAILQTSSTPRPKRKSTGVKRNHRKIMAN